ncbi:MAG: 5-formyltetrahydrofolate cyclo-ligase [Thermoguttaceae bacterium]
MSDSLDKALQKKLQLRRTIAARRESQEDGEQLSRLIWEKLRELPEFLGSRTVMIYLDVGNEVRTRQYVPELWQTGKKVVAPYCKAHELKLFYLKDMEELAPSVWQILEPTPTWQAVAERRVEPAEVDLILAPGLAFDRNGDRLGLGKGYYDRFLHRVRPDANKIGLAFECQMVEAIPVLSHDVRMDKVITEKAIYGAG